MLADPSLPPTIIRVVSLNGVMPTADHPIELTPTATGGVPDLSGIVVTGYNFASTAGGFSDQAKLYVNGLAWTTDSVPNQETLNAHPPLNDNGGVQWGINTIDVVNPAPSSGEAPLTSLAEYLEVTSAVPANVQMTTTPSKPVTNTAFTINLTGTNFATNNGFFLTNVVSGFSNDGSVKLTPSSLSSTAVTLAVPALPVSGIYFLTFSGSALTGSGLTNYPITVENPAPQITAFAASSDSGDSVLTYKVTGSNFYPGATVSIGLANRPTTFVSNTELKVQLQPTDVDGSQPVQEVFVDNFAPSVGPSNEFDVDFSNPTPVLNGLSQSEAAPGSGPLILRLFGSNFTAKSVVNWNSTTLTPTLSGSGTSQVLQVTVPASLFTTAGTAQLTVFNPSGLGGNTSVPLPFSINSSELTLDTTSAVVGSAGLTVNLTGSGFVAPGNGGTPPGSIVQFNGTNLATTYGGNNSVSATIPAALMTTAGVYDVTVTGGGSTGPAAFTVLNPAPGKPAVGTMPTLGQANTFTVTGSNFVNGAVFQILGQNYPTTFVSSTQLTINLPASAVDPSQVPSDGYASFSVENPAPDEGPSLAPGMYFQLPTPTVSSLTVTQVLVGAGDVNLFIDGSNFVSNASTAFLDLPDQGSPQPTALPTTFVSAGVLEVTIPAADLGGAAAAHTIRVVNSFPSPGVALGTGPIFSNTATFTVMNPTPEAYLALPTYSPAAPQPLPVQITIDGEGFEPGAQVTWSSTATGGFNGTLTAVNVVSSTQITVSLYAPQLAVPDTPTLTVVNPGPGGGASDPFNFAITQPLATLSQSTPPTGIAGDAQESQSISGANFLPGATLYLSGTALTTTYVSSTQLNFVVPAALLTAAGTPNLTVVNGDGQSGAAPLGFQIDETDPAPLTVSPDQAQPGAGPLTLTVGGLYFVSGATVEWSSSQGLPNFQALPTTYINGQELQATVTSSYLTTLGSYTIAVFNPSPYSSSSGVVTFNVTTTATTPPTSSVAALPQRTSLTSIPVSWSGTPGSGGAITGYDISVSTDGGAFMPWLTGTTLTSANYSASLGHTYGFFSRAHDASGNVETTHTAADTKITTTATPWRNPANPLDVLGQGAVVPADALAIIDYLNLHPGNSSLPVSAPAGSNYYDVLGQNSVVPADALQVIDYLNLHPALGFLAAAAAPAAVAAAETAQPAVVTNIASSTAIQTAAAMSAGLVGMNSAAAAVVSIGPPPLSPAVLAVSSLSVAPADENMALISDDDLVTSSSRQPSLPSRAVPSSSELARLTAKQQVADSVFADPSWWRE